MVNFAEHEHAIDPLTYRCRFCGRGELELAEESGWAGYDISGKWIGAREEFSFEASYDAD